VTYLVVPAASAPTVVQAPPGERTKDAKPKNSFNLSTLPASTAKERDQFQRDLVALIPRLRASSRSLCSRRDIADDLAQDALMKTWRERHSFERGTNLKAWLFTILRNAFYSHSGPVWWETHLEFDVAERIEAPENEQGWAAELCNTIRALRTLPDAQGDAVILVGASGFSYKDTAKICNSRTMKNLVARGRAALLSILTDECPHVLWPKWCRAYLILMEH
jgi:RNA polymerase sigma-70 factor, ECF subfamily